MTDTPVVIIDEGTNNVSEIEDTRFLTKHGYRCPVCENVIGACHDAALLADILLVWDNPNVTLPPDLSRPPRFMDPEVFHVNDVADFAIVE